MQQVLLGNSGLEVSRVAVGCWQLSPQYWGLVEQEPWRAALDVASNRGINFIDTANAYGNGFAEEQLGLYLKDRGNRDQWIIATKFYWDFWTSIPKGFGMERTVATSRKEILFACEDSLKRLGVETIDLYQLHAWDPLIQPEELAMAIKQLQDAGKIRAFGVSNLNVEQCELLSKYVPIVTLQPKYNLLYRLSEQREFPYCLTAGVSVLAYSTLERGMLGGNIQLNSRFSDAREGAGIFAADKIRMNLPVLERLKWLATQSDCTLPQLAIRWVLSHPAVSVALLGTKSPHHVTSITDSSLDSLPPVIWHEAASMASEFQHKSKP